MKTGNKILGKNEEKKRLGRDHEIMENQKKKIRETRMEISDVLSYS